MEVALGEVLSEMAEVFADSIHAEHLRREMAETFLPRWLKLARLQNDLEGTRFDTWRQGDLVFRTVAFIAPLLVAIAATRLLHSPVAALTYLVPVLLPFLPEIRAWQAARRYQRALQEIVDDMERIQKQLEAYQPALSLEEPGEADVTNRQEPRQPDTP